MMPHDVATDLRWALARRAQILAGNTPSRECRPESLEVIDRHVEIRDAQPDADRLPEVEAQTAVRAPAERQVAGPDGSSNADRADPTIGSGDVPTRDVRKGCFGSEEAKHGDQSVSLYSDHRAAVPNTEQKEDWAHAPLEADREFHVGTMLALGSMVRGSARPASHERATEGLVGYLDVSHVGPAVLGGVVFASGLVLTWRESHRELPKRPDE
jgi:hypothetical protein